MNIIEIQIGSPLYAAALDLRYSLFFKKYDLPKEITTDDMEAESTHIAVVEDEELLAYGRLSMLQDYEYRISQIVVSPQHQGKGLSKLLLERLMIDAKATGARLLKLGAQETVVGLYESLGFRPVGDVYAVELTGVLHVRMIHEIDT